MKNRFCLSGLALALLGVGVVRGQGPTEAPNLGPPLNPPGLTSSAGVEAPAGVLPEGPEAANGAQLGQPQPAVGMGVSTWLAYPRPLGCCGPIGANGPIAGELYIRSGISMPFGGGYFDKIFHSGWDIEGGVRTLLFNPEVTAAWTIDMGLTNIHYYTATSERALITNYPQQTTTTSLFGPSTQTTLVNKLITPKGLNDTFVNLAFGREWYLRGFPNWCSQDTSWRVGFDVGGRWGSRRLELLEIQHKTGALEGCFFALHTDYEYHFCSCCTLFAGVRLEYSYTFSEILQKQNNANIDMFNIVGQLGVRY